MNANEDPFFFIHRMKTPFFYTSNEDPLINLFLLRQPEPRVYLPKDTDDQYFLLEFGIKLIII